MACNVTLSSAVLEDGTLDVVSKFRTLTDEALGTDSIYMRAKDTFKELFDGKKISEAEYAQLASSFVSQLAVATTQQVMQGALTWAQAENDNPYNQAKVKADIELSIAQKEKTKHDICNVDVQTELHKANVTATMAGSMRKNGRVATMAADGYTPVTLQDEGAEWVQMKGVEAQTYGVLADTYRKSGTVVIGTAADGVVKASTGDALGYTNAQDMFARRQILSFEDSKRSHAANAVSQLIGQLVASEIVPAAPYVQQWDKALAYLTVNTIDANGDGIPDGIPDGGLDSNLTTQCLDIIGLYAADSGNPIPSVITYLGAGVIGISSVSLAAMNVAVAAKNSASEVNTRGALQSIFDNLVY